VAGLAQKITKRTKGDSPGDSWRGTPAALSLELHWRPSMIAQLSEEQRQALRAGTPVEIRDGEDIFYLISKAEYDAARSALDAEDIDPSFLSSTMTKNG
jgi:hypothetical protein